MANRESVDAKRFEGWDAGEAYGPGAFMIQGDGEEKDFLFILPGEDFWRSIRIKTGPKVDNAWQWDGNLETPTLHPSILAWDRADHKVEHWHGWLQNGRFNSV